MVWELLDDFSRRLKTRDKAIVQSSVAVVSAFTPIRYAHVNRSVPLWRNEHVAVFWAYRDKKRQADGSRRGFAWHVVMVLREVKEAVGVIWRAWHSLAKRQAFSREVPSFLSCNFWTGALVKTAEFNKFLIGVLGNMVTNSSLISSYCLRRLQPTALDVRDAPWEDRHKVAAWSMPGARMEDCMPVRYSGMRAAGEVEVKAVQQFMFRAMRGQVQSWAQARKWWVQQPPNTLSTWHAEAAQICMSESTKEVAARVGDLVHTSLQPTFDLVKEGHAPGKCQLGNPDLGSPAGSREASRSSAEQSALDNRGGGSGTWVAPRRRGAYAHACRGAVPLCKQKRSSFKAGLKGRVVTFESREHAEKEGRVICPLCMQIAKQNTTECH